MNTKNRAYTLLIYSALAAWLLMGCLSVPPPEGQIPQEAVAEPVPSVHISSAHIEGDFEAQCRILRIFAQAYPDKISGVEFINGDWTMLVNGERFYYAHGRFLPEALREQWEDFYPWDFYEYPWVGTDQQRQTAFNNPVYSVGSSFLFDALYASPTEDDSWYWQEKYSFLGVKMLVHPHIAPLLDSIVAQIHAVAQSDSSINEWISELQTAPPSFGWNWRTIANTHRRSNHSYGTALDLLPRDLQGRTTYWQWNPNATGRQKQYVPPEAVISAFEAHGFIWGGNWDIIDTMHFEYRPEILLLNDIPIKVLIER